MDACIDQESELVMATATYHLSLEELRSSKIATITRTQAAEILGVDPRTVSKGIADGTIPSIKIGRLQLIPREKFLALFDSQEAAR